jgi:transposase
VCHRWFTRGQRPTGLCDQRYTWAHLFAAVRPATGQSFALVLPELSTEAMQVFLEMFAATLAPDEHAALVADQAGWHIAEALRVPDNVTLVYLPSYSPELNPVERVWLYLRERHLSHRLLDGYEAIVDALCHAWKQLTAERFRSLTQYPYLQKPGLDLTDTVARSANCVDERGIESAVDGIDADRSASASWSSPPAA